MRKWIYIAIGAVALLWLLKVPVLSFALEKSIRIPISFSWVSIMPSETKIWGLTVKNPEGFSSSVALETSKTILDYQWKTLWGKQIILDEISMDQIFIGVEFKGGSQSDNNWTAIGKSMPKPKSSHSLLIRKLILTNFTIEIRGFGPLKQTITRHVDRLEFDNINSNQGFPTEALIQQIFGGLSLGQYIEGVFNPVNLIEDVVEPFNLFGKSEL